MNPFDFLTNAVRAKEIVAVLVRLGFADLVQHLNPPAGFLQRIVPQPSVRRTTWERIRLAAEELGPTFVKSGQLLSMRPDLVPEPLVIELRKLQDDVKPVAFEEIDKVLRAELGEAWETDFAEFDKEPIASASLAQVYRARLRDGGRVVAVKVQRPGIAKAIDADLELLAFFAKQLQERVRALAPFDLPGVAAAIREAIDSELDFENEARHLRIFNATNAFPDKVFAPGIVDEFTTPRVVVQTFIEGERIDASHLDPEHRRKLAHDGSRSLFHQIMVQGFFHADPHPGNLLVTADGRLCLLDWGMVGQLTRRMRGFLADLFEAAAANDAERLVAIAGSMASPGARPNFREMEKEVMLALRENFNPAIGEQQIGRIILKLLNIFSRNGISVVRDYSLMAKAVVSIEEAGHSLDPDFDLRTIAAPIVKQIHRERHSPTSMIRQLRSWFTFGAGRFGDLPADLNRIARRIAQDDLTINFQHKGLEDLDDSINSASSRITIAVVIAALIIGSSLIITTNIPPLLFGYSALGITGYLLSAVLGLWVVWDIVRHGRHR
ncbi:MAG TPA: AarF/UbiB family protein [Opitutaceae bacterium]|nr:AarF/UbiB family protein [Opitutaceae bacterium]